MASWETGDVTANGIRLHYTRTGGGKPPLVLAHGVTDGGLCWAPVAEALAPDYDVIMVDARGHGRSEAPERNYDSRTQAADLHGAIVALGLQRPAVLGHSMGAATALVLAGTYPAAPGAILLEDPPGWWGAAPAVQADDAAGTRADAVIYGRARANEERQVGMRAWFTNLKRKSRDELIAEQHAATPSWSEAELGPWADAKLQVSPHVLSVFDPQAPGTVDWPAVLGRITCPALLITSDPALGAVLPAEGVTALQALVPQLQVAHIAGAGHNIRREQFPRYLAVVRAFLAGVAAS
jgi:pimeloyl-ACP methyl ester carboxylesterase